MPDLSTCTLGQTEEPLHLHTSAEHRAVVLSLASQATRTLCIHTRDLDPAVYDSAALNAAILQLVRNNRRAEVRILVQDSTRAVREGHGLVRLGQQLSSRIHFRVPGPDHRDFNEAFLVADVTGYVHRPLADQYTGVAVFKAPFEARRLLQYFDEVWERADSDPQLRRLFL